MTKDFFYEIYVSIQCVNVFSTCQTALRIIDDFFAKTLYILSYLVVVEKKGLGD